MAKWEYLVYDVGLNNEPKELERKLNEMGSEGWELVSVDWYGSIFIFKREKD